MKNHPINAETRRVQRPAKKIFLTLGVLCASALICAAQTTQVMFPLQSLFGGAAYNRPLTITAANALVSDGQNLWAGSYTIIPASTTNPLVSLYPNTYLLTVPGVVRPVRFSVPASTNVLDVTTLLTSGPLFYFGTNGMANLVPGNNVSFTTNGDGSITVSASGGANTNTLTPWQEAVVNSAVTNTQAGVWLSGTFVGQLNGAATSASYATTAGTATNLASTSSISGSQVSGTVAQASYANTAGGATLATLAQGLANGTANTLLTNAIQNGQSLPMLGNGGGLTNLPFIKTVTAAGGSVSFSENSDGSSNLNLTVTGGGGGGNVYSNTVTTFTSLALTGNKIAASDGNYLDYYSPALDNYYAGAAGNAAMTGNEELLLGYGAGASLTTGIQNILEGYGAGYLVNVGTYNVAIGVNAMRYDNADQDDVIVGHGIFSAVNGTNLHSVFIGNLAGQAATNTQYNVGVGPDVMENITSGSYNTAIGGHSAVQNMVGNYNTDLGLNAGEGSTNSYNLFAGYNSAVNSIIGAGWNVGLGPETCWQLYSGAYNINIGTAFSAPTNTSYSIQIGTSLGGIQADNQNGLLNIGNLIMGSGLTSGSTLANGVGQFYGTLQVTNAGLATVINSNSLMTGTVTATNFSGNGAGLTNLPGSVLATNVVSGLSITNPTIAGTATLAIASVTNQFRLTSPAGITNESAINPAGFLTNSMVSSMGTYPYETVMTNGAVTFPLAITNGSTVYIAGVTTVGGNLVPSTDNSRNLGGGTSARFASIYGVGLFSTTINNLGTLTASNVVTTNGVVLIQPTAAAFNWGLIPPFSATATNWWVGTWTNGALCALYSNTATTYAIKQLAP